MLHCSAHFFSLPVSFPTNPDDALLQWNPGTKMYAIQLALCMMWYCHLTSGEKRASIFFFILYFAGITHITIPYPDCANANPGCLYFNRPSSDSEINVNTQVFSVLSSSSLTTVSLSLSLSLIVLFTSSKVKVSVCHFGKTVCAPMHISWSRSVQIPSYYDFYWCEMYEYMTLFKDWM